LVGAATAAYEDERTASVRRFASAEELGRKHYFLFVVFASVEKLHSQVS
jgi:hypothetical protein